MNKENTRLVELRKQFNLTQDQLAEKVGVTQSAIAFYEAGTKDPGKLIKIKLAKVFGVTVEYLFYELYYDVKS
ncbi:helix-turn-helix transcriptional regulator [Bacillota bacterium Lsc_1132]